MNKSKTMLTASFLLLLASCSSQKSMESDKETIALGEENQQVEAPKNYLSKGELAAKFKPVYFDFDSSRLNYDGQRAVQDMAEVIKNAKFEEAIIIGGHTDPVGEKTYNYTLGKERAAQVRNHLVELGVEPSKLKIVSYGEATVLNSGKMTNAMLRRVEFSFTEPVFKPEIQKLGYAD